MSLGRADLLDAPVTHDRDPVGQRQRLVLVMRHHQRREAQALLQLAELDLHALTQLLVERAQAARPAAAPRVRSPARGPGPRAAAGRRKAGAAYGRRERSSFTIASAPATRLADLRFRQPPHLQTEGDVARHVQMREQRVALEQHADVAPMHRQPGDRLALDGGSLRRWAPPGRQSSACVVVLPQPLGPSSDEQMPPARR